ncbi:MAG: NfeD family protein [Brevinematales bacterium]|nr:NfeD family protein [Brevinematales bacterium]
MDWYIWMIIGVALIVIEIFTPGFFMLLPGVAGVVAGVVAIWVPSLAIQITVFILLSAALIIFLRPFVLKMTGKNQQETNADGMIGKVVLVTEDIDNKTDKGYIKYYSDHFPARSESGTSFVKGEMVRIVRMDGIKVYVESAGAGDTEALENK